eukprot:gene46905-11849_t
MVFAPATEYAYDERCTPGETVTLIDKGTNPPLQC